MLDVIAAVWGWKDIQPAESVMQNAFGNVVFKDNEGRYWRICPEEPSCEVIARTEAEFERLRLDDEFTLDWRMESLVELAEQQLGPVEDDRCYCLKTPAVLGGQYAAENLGTMSRREAIAFAGDLAKQIDHLPDGSKIRLRVVD
jgi:hypothetical protein